MQIIKLLISLSCRRILFGVSISLLASSTATAQTADKAAIVRKCESEAIISLRIASAFFELFGKSKEKTLDFAKGARENGSEIANNLFDLAESKAINSPAEFATERIFSCFQKQNFPLSGKATPKNSTKCFAGSEAIYYAYTLRTITNLSKDSTLSAMETMQKDRDIWPSALLKYVIDLSFNGSNNADTVAGNQMTFFWNCLASAPDSKK